jgi:DNA (cytosine-5)-methyltransferase 1
MNFKFIDLFAGIGGFRIALEAIGGECVFSSEWNKSAQETYKNNFGHLPSGDISKIKANQIPLHDVLCAGFPCQAFSKSGKMKGFHDARGTLFFEVLRIAKAKKPKVVFLENVANLLNHDQGNTFQVIKNSLEEIGYKVSFKVLNAKDFGLPQNRQRIIIVASFKELDFAKIKTKTLKTLEQTIEYSNQEVLNTKQYTLVPEEKIKIQDSGLKFCGFLNKPMRKKGVREEAIFNSRNHKQPNRIYHLSGTHPTLSSQESSGRYYVYDGKKVFKLSLKDCYKIQGFPKNFRIHKTKTEAYRQIGNSVPINLIKAVAQEIKNQLLTK